MASSSVTQGSSSDSLVLVPTPAVSSGSLSSKNVVDSKGQSSKGLWVVAIIVGSVVFLGAVGFGTVGLLKSYGVITLNHSFEWLSIAIDFVGQTPHFISLWGITAGGVVLEGGLIALCTYKIHIAGKKTEETKVEEKRNDPLTNFSAENLATIPNYAQETFEDLEKGTFTIQKRVIAQRGHKVDDIIPARYFIVLRNADGKLLSNNLGTLEDTKQLGLSLIEKPGDFMTAIHLFFSLTPPKDVPLDTTGVRTDAFKIIELTPPGGDNVFYMLIKTRGPEGKLLYSIPLDEDMVDHIEGLLPE